MLSDVVSLLRCPAHPPDTDEPLSVDGATLRCRSGHAFDIAARQNYVNLTIRNPGTGDTAEMVRARDAWLEGGHYAPLAQRLADLVAEHSPGKVADIGAGTGHYLAAALNETGNAVGLALDLSRYAVRRAARKHPRIGAVVADVWGPLPVRSDSVDVLLNVFAPRNGPEFARMLRADGMLVVATPATHHLEELSRALGLLTVDEDKRGRLETSLASWFSRSDGHAATERLEFELCLSHQEAADLAGMGPSAWHLTSEDVPARVAELPEPFVTTAAIEISCWSPRRRVRSDRED